MFEFLFGILMALLGVVLWKHRQILYEIAKRKAGLAVLEVTFRREGERFYASGGGEEATGASSHEALGALIIRLRDRYFSRTIILGERP